MTEMLTLPPELMAKLTIVLTALDLIKMGGPLTPDQMLHWQIAMDALEEVIEALPVEPIESL